MLPGPGGGPESCRQAALGKINTHTSFPVRAAFPVATIRPPTPGCETRLCLCAVSRNRRASKGWKRAVAWEVGSVWQKCHLAPRLGADQPPRQSVVKTGVVGGGVPQALWSWGLCWGWWQWGVLHAPVLRSLRLRWPLSQPYWGVRFSAFQSPLEFPDTAEAAVFLLTQRDGVQGEIKPPGFGRGQRLGLFCV